MPQGNAAAAAALLDHGGDAGDAVMARWLQSAGLQHLASPLASTAIDHRLLPNLLMQGYGAQSAEEKQRLLKLMRNLNFNGESGSEPYTPTAQSLGGVAGSDGFYSPEFRGDFGAGLLDLHAMDDTELLSEHVVSEAFEPSPFMHGDTRVFEDDFNPINSKLESGEADTDASISLPMNSTRENNVAKIKVVVRKRPLNKKELAKKEDDVVTVADNAYLTVHEPKLKVDLTAYVEKHEFCFDAVLDEHVTNDEVYRSTVEPIIPTIFERTKATCFAYGQTGSGKTYTMQPLPLRAAEDLVRQLHQPVYRNQRFKLWLSYFEIYGGKLYDLLSDRKKLCMREDGRQQVCIVGLQEFEVCDVQIVKEFIEKGGAARSTGSTGANEESSRSHAILQLAVKKHSEVKASKRNNDGNEARSGKVVGKISFIDLAGSERGADTTDNDRQTRIEGAEINKSLLALKECIRALDNDQIHIPFRGSKLTEVLRDSFVGNSKTVMISCISPGAGSCEHTLNTLRYADRVKSLSKSGNPRKDQVPNAVPQTNNKDVSSTSSFPASSGAEDFNDQRQEKTMDMGRKFVEKENSLHSSAAASVDKQPVSYSSNYLSNGRDEKGFPSASVDRERFEVKNSHGDSTSQKMNSYSQSDTDEKVQKVSPPRRKGYKDEKSERSANWMKKDANDSDLFTTSSKQQSTGNYSTLSKDEKSERPAKWMKRDATGADLITTSSKQQSTGSYSTLSKDEKSERPANWMKRDANGSDPFTTSSKQQSTGNYNNITTGSRINETESSPDGNVSAVLEEEEALIAAHRKEIEDTMEIVREEMKLLAEVDQPGSLIDNYVTKLNFVLSRKAASLVGLQARLARFQHRLKEQEILSRKRVPRQ
ncbi:Kinesin-like protein KIN-13A [Glycine soja]